ncbi:cohesin domain-containing protein [Chloroflexota bacterium]
MNLKGLASLGLMLITLLSISSSIPAHAQGEVAVEIATLEWVIADSDFSVYVEISDVTNFDAGQFDISFDSTVLRLDSVDYGLIGEDTIPVNQFEPYPQGSTGTYRIVVNIPGFPGVSGSGYLAELRFHVIGSAGQSSELLLSNGFINDNEANEINVATWNGDSVTVFEQLAIITDSIPDGQVRIPYSVVVSAQGGTGNYTWSVPPYNLPDGLVLNTETGEIWGTPTIIGGISSAIEVTDGLFYTSKVLTIYIAGRPGDANEDSELNTADITTIELIIMGQRSMSVSADANLDSTINTADITKTERLIAGID